ncbi:MAG: glutathione S-transferase [Gammaproteobacteria bacterium SG8_30]|jgi:GST-like protein|nr:MAG: glutathione S-transferase [Gammaproteobacteria bacterium SG8_30]
MYTLYARDGWGSAIVEAQLAWYGIDYQRQVVGDLFHSAEAREELARFNRITQVPTLVLPGGRVMTESAAITLHLADATGSEELVPGPAAAERPDFLRWLVFLVANIYPTFTYADDPSRFVDVEDARAPFRRSVDAYARRLWTIVEQAAGRPWFLGSRFSAMDLYLAVMTHWRPGREWFAANAPRLAAIADAVDKETRLVEVWRRNFGEAG